MQDGKGERSSHRACVRPSLCRWLRGVLLLALGLTFAFAEPVKQKLVVGINRDYPPYEYLDAKGQPAGYDVDLLRKVAELEGLDLEFRADTWENTLGAFREGRVQLLAGLLHSKAREAFAEFSSPHLVVHYTLFVRKGDLRIHDASNLAGHRVLVERQSQMHENLRASGLEQGLILVDSEPEALRRLARGEGDAAIVPQLQGLVLASKDHLPIQAVGGPLLTRQLCFAAAKGDIELISKLNTGLAILNQTGRYADIYGAWFGDLRSDSGAGLALARKVLVILAILGAALVLMAAWSWSLRRQVMQATLRLRRANRDIREREAYLDTVIEHLPVAVFGKDPRNGFAFTLWNAESERMFGLRKEDVLSKTDYDFFPKDQADFFRAKDQDVVREGRVLDIPEERISSKSMGEITLHTRKLPLFDEAGEPYLLLGISENITEQRAMEEALRQGQKLESLGVLAGGIAHDFNNLLTAMLGNLSLAQLQAPPGHAILPFLHNAEATALRAADLTRQMLDYAGKGVFVVKPVDLNRAAGDMASLLKVSISKKVGLRFAFQDGLPPIQADTAQLQQVVMNLVTNASEAIGEGEGEILLTTGLMELDATQAALLHPGSPIPPGHYVTLAVKDDGAGMSAEVLSRIFDPFFTTKFSGRGLGLSAMLGILRAHRTGISIQSEPGLGTEFRLFFPPGKDAGGEVLLPQPPSPASQARGTILLVDDEPDIRHATSALLKRAGYEVLEAADGLEACVAYRRDQAHIRVVLMDQTMPRMDGRTAAREILALDPGAKIILTSGFPMGPDIRMPASGGLAAFLPKPYQREDLLAALQRVIEPS